MLIVQLCAPIYATPQQLMLETPMVKYSLCRLALAAAAVIFAAAPYASAQEKRRPRELDGYWAFESVTIDGKKQNGEPGAFFIIRHDGTYRIAKRGSKPE